MSQTIAIAHRGGGFDAIKKGFAENTADAFRFAVHELGYKYVETDVRVGTDGKLYAWHGSGLERFFYWRPTKLKVGADVNTLEEILGVLPPDVKISVDLKHAQAIDPFVEVIAKTGSAGRVIVGSFIEGRTKRAVQGIHQMTGIRPMAAMGIWSTAKLMWRSKFRPGKEWETSFSVCWLPYTMASPSVIRTAHAAGVALYAWTVNRRADMQRLIDMNADGILTDELVLLDKLLGPSRRP